MQQIERLTKDDFAKYKNIFTVLGIMSGQEVDDGYKIAMDGREFLVFPLGPIIMCYTEVNGVVKSSIMQTDENGKLVAFTHNGKQIVLNNRGIDVLDEDHNQQSLYLIRDAKGDVNSSSNGIVSFLQYRASDDVSLDLRYEHNIFRNNREIYPYHIDDPFYVSFKQRASKHSFWNMGRSYYKLDFSIWDNKLGYDIATIKEFGLGAVLSSNTISLQAKTAFSKFYRVLLQVGEYCTVTGYPFTKQYNEEDIDEMIEKAGFSKTIPSSLIDLYNNIGSFVEGRQKIIDMCHEDEIKLTR